MPNIGDRPQYASMNRSAGDLQPIVLIAGDFMQIPPAHELSLADDLQLMEELDSELQGAFQDAHNTGSYIIEYTTKINAMQDDFMDASSWWSALSEAASR